MARLYNTTPEFVAEMRKQQNNCCALCGKPFEDTKALRPCLDHCHETGRLRSLLHNKCNGGLGMFNDDPVLLEQGAVYLRSHAVSHGS